ncbi:MAG TPA: class I SAM-dependent methyltransferase [Bacteriovoracaceae bacterium]|nr:class I SAM-dependent methyltransferase [Bacteriovoracaceae bacterium]
MKLVEGESGRVRDGDIYPMLKRWVAQYSPKNILEVGCGQGVCCERLEYPRGKYTGIDCDPRLIARAEELYPAVGRKFIVGDACALPVADSSFEAVFTISVWHLLEDLGKAAAELHRILVEGGQFFIITANPAAYPYWKDSYSEVKIDGQRLEGRRPCFDGSLIDEVLYLHPLEQITAALLSAGFRMTEVKTFRSSQKFPGTDVFLSIQGEK